MRSLTLTVPVVWALVAACGSSDGSRSAGGDPDGGAGGASTVSGGRSGAGGGAATGGRSGSGGASTGSGGASAAGGGSNSGGDGSDASVDGATGGADGGDAGDGGSDASDMDGGDAAVPLFERMDDGTVTLSHSAHCGPALAFDSSGTAFVLHTVLGDLVTSGVRVSRLVGRTWTLVGGIVNDLDHQLDINVCPALVVTPAGGIYVAFHQHTNPGGQSRTRVRRFDGNGWVTAGATDASVLDLDLVPDQNGAPVLVTTELTSNHLLTVRRLVGETFELHTTTNAPPAQSVHAAVRPDGTLVVLYANAVGGFGKALDVTSLSGDTFSALGTLDSVPDTSQALHAGDIDVDATRIWVTWQKRTSLSEPTLVHTHRREGSAWTSLATAEGAQPTLAIDGGSFAQVYNLDVTIIDGRRHDGSTFGAATRIPLPASFSRLVTHAGATYLAYTEGPVVAHVGRLNLP